MERSEESDTADPQKERRRLRSWGQPRESTSVAVSERAQQNDYSCLISTISIGRVGRDILNPTPSTPSPHLSNTQSRYPSNTYNPPRSASPT